MYVNSGSYGCVFRPAVRCKDSKYTSQANQVGKVFFDAVDAEDEWDETRVVKNIDKEKKYTIQPVRRCVVKKSDIFDSELNNCNRGEDDALFTGDEFVQIIYPDGGYDLTRPNINFPSLMLPLLNVLQGIEQIDKHGYAHTDISPRNMVHTYNRNRQVNKVYLIDFGLMCMKTELYDPGHIQSRMSNSEFSPPEMRMFAYWYELKADNPHALSPEVRRKLRRTLNNLKYFADIRGTTDVQITEWEHFWVYGIGTSAVALFDILKGLKAKHPKLYRLLHPINVFEPRGQTAFFKACGTIVNNGSDLNSPHLKKSAASKDIYCFACSLLQIALQTNTISTNSGGLKALASFIVRCMSFNVAARPSPTSAIRMWERVINADTQIVRRVNASTQSEPHESSLTSLTSLAIPLVGGRQSKNKNNKSSRV